MLLVRERASWLLNGLGGLMMVRRLPRMRIALLGVIGGIGGTVEYPVVDLILKHAPDHGPANDYEGNRINGNEVGLEVQTRNEVSDPEHNHDRTENEGVEVQEITYLRKQRWSFGH